MIADRRNAYGYPILFRIERAKRIAAAARQRKLQQCDCEHCRKKDQEEAVIQITQRWKS